MRYLVSYYLHQPFDMHFELTLNGALLIEHLQRFAAGGKYSGKRFVLLDIEVHRNTPPTPLSSEFSEFEKSRFTYVIKLNALYRGTELVLSPIEGCW